MNIMRYLTALLALAVGLWGCQTGSQTTGQDRNRQQEPLLADRGDDEAEEAEEEAEVEEPEEEPVVKKTSPRRKAHGQSEAHDRRFENPEKLAEKWNAPERDTWQKPDTVLETLGADEGMTVVDLGAGTGYFVGKLSPVVGETGTVVALDIEQPMVDYIDQMAQEQGLTNVEARKVPADDPQLEASSADRVLTVNTWHHIPQREAYAQKLFEALTPGGAVVVVDYTMEAEQGPPAEKRVEPTQVAQELEQAGFAVEVDEQSLPRQYMIVGLKPTQ